MIASQKTEDADCPQSSVLHDYVLGRLHPPELDECEAHVAECDLCHETLRTLDTSDTLSEKVAEVISGSSDQEDPAHTADESQHRIGRLIGRLTSREFVLANGGHNLSRHGMTPAESELLADRAAEVLRYVKEESSDAEGALGRLGDYRLLHLIGAGSTGVVFQAQDLSLDRLVALKVLRPSLGELARQRFLAEARSAASIEHANVVAIYQVGQVDRLAFMAMQWQPGQTLESKLRSGDRFDNDATSQIIKQIAAGLEAAHQNQVVHRDIKPANIWLCENDDEVKILDFGLARIPDDDPGLTATGMLAGTPNFMSPEQSRGLELDGRSDLFSLGCVMYQLLTSRLPFGAPTVLATLQSIQNDSPLVPQSIEPSITDELSDLTMSLLEKQPANRPQTAAQLIDMLGEDHASWPLHVNRYAASHTPADSSADIGRKPQPSNAASWSSRLWQTVALLLIGTAAWWWAPQIIRIATDQGEVVIEAHDDAVEVQVFENGELIRVVDTKTQQAFDLKSGNYTIKATGDDSAAGTFEVTPNSLVMKRGEQQIVRVTQQPSAKAEEPDHQLKKAVEIAASGQGSAELMKEITAVLAEAQSQPTETPSNVTGVADPAQSTNSISKVRPLKYDGKTFDQWFDIATYDHQEVRYSQALRGCVEIATKEELAKIMKLYRQIARNRVKVRHVNSRNESMKTMRDILNEIPAKEAVDFVIEEVAVGTKSSRQLCTFWIANSKHKKELLGRTEELLSTIVASLDHPGVEDCMEELIKLVAPDKTERPKKKKEMSTTQKQFHEAILGGSSEFRTRYCYPAISWLGYQQDLFAKYADDILNSDTDPLARLKIFNAISTSGAGPVDDRAKLFQKIANDVLAGDKRQLQVHPRSDKHDAWLVQTALLNIYRSAGDISEETRKQFLIPQIENMAALVRSSTEKSDNPRKKLMGKSISVGKMRIHLADLEFLVEHLRGNADAKMPRLSIFKGAN